MTPQHTATGNGSLFAAQSGRASARACRALADEVRHWKSLYARFRQACRRQVLDFLIDVHACVPMR